MNAIEKLSAELGCHPADLKSLAVGVAESMKKDKVSQTFINHPEFQVALTEAYVADQLKKFDRFVTRYLSNTEARTAFQCKVFELLEA